MNPVCSPKCWSSSGYSTWSLIDILTSFLSSTKCTWRTLNYLLICTCLPLSALHPLYSLMSILPLIKLIKVQGHSSHSPRQRLRRAGFANWDGAASSPLWVMEGWINERMNIMFSDTSNSFMCVRKLFNALILLSYTKFIFCY